MKTVWEIYRLREIEPEALKNGILEITSDFLINSSLLPSNEIYPGIEDWFEKVKKEAQSTPKEREVFFSAVKNEYENALKIVAILIVKNKNGEKKICTIRVDEAYRNQGIGSALMKKALEYLGTNKPLITVPEECCPMLKRLLDKYEFNLTSQKLGYYRQGKIEYFYNEHTIID